MTRVTISLWGCFLLSALQLPCLSETAKEKEKTPPPGFFDITAIQASGMLKNYQKLVILDIRTPREYRKGHLKNACNLDYWHKEFEAKLKILDKTKAYLVHCASGGRSGKAMKIFKRLEFQTVYHIKDGYQGWTKAELPVETPEAREEGRL